MHFSLIVLLSLASASVFAATTRLTGKFNVNAYYENKLEIKLVLSDDNQPVLTKDYVFLKDLKVKPIGEGSSDVYGVVLEDGRKIYDNDLIVVEAEKISFVNGMVYAEKPVVKKIIEENLRVACLSDVDAKGQTYFAYFGYWTTKSSAKPDTFMRVDYCDLHDKNSSVCSRTWGTGYFYQSENTVKASEPLMVQTSFKQQSFQYDMRRMFIEKYSEKAYWDVFFKQQEQFKMGLETMGSFAELPVFKRPVGSRNEALLKLQENLVPNTTLRWTNKLAEMEIGGEVTMFCFTWN